MLFICVCIYVCWWSPDQEMDVLCSYVEQLAIQNSLHLYTVSYECEHEQANVSSSALSAKSHSVIDC